MTKIKKKQKRHLKNEKKIKVTQKIPKQKNPNKKEMPKKK